MKRLGNRWLLSCLVLLVVFTCTSPVAIGGKRSVEEYGVPLTEDELQMSEGDWGPILVGAISGAVTSGFSYGCGTDRPTLRGLARSVVSGAAWGAAGGVFATIRLIGTGKSLAFSAADAAWSSWAGANVGALKGAASHITRRWRSGW